MDCLPPALIAASTSHRFPRGSSVLVEGVRVTAVFFVCSGVVRLTKAAKDRVVTTGLRLPGAMLGTADAIADAPSMVSVDAMTACELRLIPASRFAALVGDDLGVSTFMHRLHAAEMRRHVADLAVRTALSIREQIVWLAAELAPALGDRAPHDGILLPLRQAEIADAIGCTPEHLNRVLAGLERRGYLRRSRDGLILRAGSDPDRRPIKTVQPH